MTALDTLMTDGLDLVALEGGSTAELLEWQSVAGGHYPDADMTVMLWLQYADGTADWCSGWWNGEQWLDCASGDKVGGVVTHWAEPEGPAA